MTSIKAVALDVDGVLTDGAIWWSPEGAEWKRICFRDIMGVSRARKAGFVIALISGEDSPLIDRFAQKMGIADVYKGCRDKAAALCRFAQGHGYDLREIAFMGDDVNDVAAMKLCGLSAAPENAHPSARAAATLVTRCAGGNGAVRELLDQLLADS